jgi:arabinogalactan oligomer/maltooligosaccharide transport system permease protein
MIVATATALLTVMLGALAAYAFSRFRFKGRRTGMVFLLLVQMFPQVLTIVALYLIVLHIGTVFGVVGLNTLTGLIFVYLGGVLSVNVWFMKGFFDTIPKELDESARVDGATPAQIFWGVVLPLGAPVLAVIGLFSFVATINEFIIASVLLEDDKKKTLAVGMQGFIDKQYSQHWGPFAAGTLIAAVPVVLLFIFLQRFIVEGLTTGSVKG